MKNIDLGVFLPIINNGWIISKNAPKNMPTFELNKEIAQLAEESEFDYVFSLGRFRGFGGDTEFWDYSLDSLTLMSALAAVTKDIKLITTIKPFLVQPVVAAKMLATLDEVSNGRMGVNIVTGYHRDEFTQIGDMEKADNWASYRYEHAKEWLDAVKMLWSEKRSTYEGEYIQLQDAMSDPKPVQKPYPRLICAGVSEKGMNFTVKEAGESFIAGTSFEQVKENSLKVKKFAQENNIAVKTHTPITIIQGDTDEEAQELVRHFEEGADLEALKYMGLLYGNQEGSAKTILEQTKQSVFYGCLPLVGSPETIANTIEDLAVNGDLDGVLFTFPDFIKGINEFNDKVAPILAEKGLRNVMVGSK